MPFNCNKCKDKCKAECCSMANLLPDEFARLSPKALRPFTSIDMGDFTILIDENGKCPFLKNNLDCSVYHDRPAVCKSFGTGKGFDGRTHPMMFCRWQNPDGSLNKKPAESVSLEDLIKQLEND